MCIALSVFGPHGIWLWAIMPALHPKLIVIIRLWLRLVSMLLCRRNRICVHLRMIYDPNHSLIVAPIMIGSQAWIAADAFVGMGVTIGEGAVVGARAVVMKDVEPWTVVAGNPARFIKKRELRDA